MSKLCAMCGHECEDELCAYHHVLDEEFAPVNKEMCNILHRKKPIQLDDLAHCEVITDNHG